MVPEQLFDLTGKVAIVTGASKGIGKDVARLLAQAGASIALVARNKSELEKVAAEIHLIGRNAIVVPFDLTETSKIPKMVERIKDHFGHIDILINNAGLNIAKDAEMLTEEDWDKVMDINLKSVFFLCKEAGRFMREQKHGKIINMSSQMAFVGYYKRSAYSASKGGLTQLTKSLAIEWAQEKINVNAIAPTFIETEMTKSMFEDEDFRAQVLNRIPLGRLAKTEDIYGSVLYLASDSSNMVTGHTICVDGGWTVW
ncbi:SDR family NAD(P)-dependent oxidoreductase [Halobacillus naozhouensis]|uniref:Glucose 1-dehydrogenase n=1 Tax=Halobacillus naozhouensis TaxID=554880 RepID=A0ABY8J2C0_9BACI|nr:glucose 1-dehydrogenase [Halobacillus naozhouensis]WFT75564.1 glucose 1-dehydrogenase [Halobacillus naozhouensis]